MSRRTVSTNRILLGKIAAMALAAVAAGFFFLNTWQSFRYEQVRRRVERLEAEQKDWLEKNKRLVAGISLLESPRRIGELAKNEFQLIPLSAESLERIYFLSETSSEDTDHE